MSTKYWKTIVSQNVYGGKGGGGGGGLYLWMLKNRC